MNFLLIILAVLICFSAFFSAAETSFMSASVIKLKNHASGGKKRAALALRLLDNYDSLISSILVGNNIVNIASSGVAALFFVRLFGDAGVSVATLVTTVLVLIFGEITPKTIAREAPEQFAMFSAPVLKLFIFIFTPLNMLSARWKALVMKLLRFSNNRSITEAELISFVEEARQEGGINEGEEAMIKRTIDFDERSAWDVCTPRMDIAAVSVNSDIKDIEECFRTTRFSRLPVYEGSIDNIIGIILYKDFRYDVLSGTQTPQKIMKEIVSVPKSIKAPRLLKKMQENKSHLAVVLDEFGGTAGIVTVEDIVEELVGEIWDEHDEVIENITKLSGGRTRILGRTPLKELSEYYHISGFEEEARETLATWILQHYGSALNAGDKISFYGVALSISKVRHGRVTEAAAG
ncbi:MAG: hemolysin family protein [Spirochaetaceae bacterium]|jgi:CBS domain containing-hemolysin-like protein|nr:hemolysin family protein [Spirochaetaceae bacterium]GMO28933.1 MAG: hemolysin family protein [Termitinemataceae bacterium]